MTRTYTLRRRAEQQADTRRRIVEAAVDLHSSIGPAATTFSMIAEHAGVQRHTLYAHFPDERSLHLACSGLAMERDPLPEATPWRAFADRQERLRTGLAAIYGWYERNASLAACVLRDAEHHALTKEIAEMRMGPAMADYVDHYVKRTGLDPRPHLDTYLAYNFFRIAAILQGIVGRVRDGTATSEHAPAKAEMIRPLAVKAWAFAQAAGARG